MLEISAVVVLVTSTVEPPVTDPVADSFAVEVWNTLDEIKPLGDELELLIRLSLGPCVEVAEENSVTEEVQLASDCKMDEANTVELALAICDRDSDVADSVDIALDTTEVELKASRILDVVTKTDESVEVLDTVLGDDQVVLPF